VADEIEQVRGVLAVVNRESAIEADTLGVFAKQPRADGVKGPGPADGVGHRSGALAQRLRRDVLDAPAHFGRGAAREGQQQHAARIGAVDDEMRHPMGERVGLAGAGAGNDQKRAGIGQRRCAVLHGPALLRIEFREIRGRHGRPPKPAV
jgi:hypothetical protein